MTEQAADPNYHRAHLAVWRAVKRGTLKRSPVVRWLCDRCHRLAHHQTITHCPQGHPYAGDNLIFEQGRRRCLTCRRESWRQSTRRYQRSLNHG